MYPQKHKTAIALCALMLVAGLLAGCAAQAASGTGQGQSTANSTAGVVPEQVTEEDLDASWDEATATHIDLDGSTAKVDGKGASVDGSVITITAAGTYVVSGSLDDGQIVVDAPAEALVRLVLNGAQISCSTTSPVYCLQADKLLVILAEDTENSLSDGAGYVFSDEETDEPNAALFSHEDLTINGTGTLVVNAAYNNGIGTKDDLIIVSGRIRVQAVNHAIRGRDSVTVLDGTFELEAGNDGIQANNDADTEKGWIELYGGSYTIVSAHDGIQAETNLTIAGGSYTITAGGGSANAPERAEEAFGPGGGMPGAMPADGTRPEMPADGSWPEMPAGGMPGTPPDAQPADAGSTAPAASGATDDTAQETETTEETDDSDTSTSYKGLKAGGELTVSGGSFVVDSADDGVHSNTNISISGGNFTIDTGDDGMHADATLLIEGEPVIDIRQSYEGLEGATVTIEGGNIQVVATDDGINAAGGRDDTAGGGRFGADQFAAGDYEVNIVGGSISLTAGTDGIDSNGDINISGGTLVINMTNDQSIGGDGILDRDGSLSITGGTVVGAGGNGVVTIGPNTTTGTSSQCTLDLYYSEVKTAGTNVELRDASGNTIAGITPDNNFQCVVFSTPEMQQGETYAVYTGGELTLEITLTEPVTSVRDTGEAVTEGNMAGGFPQGGMVPPGATGT